MANKNQRVRKAPPELNPEDLKTGLNPYFIIILFLSLIVPVIVMPGVVDNAFNTPKTIIMVICISMLVLIYCISFFRGQGVLKSETATHKIILFLIILNAFSFLYTKNIYFTRIAAVLNIACLVLLYVISLYIDNKRSLALIGASAFSGLLVSIVAWLQFFNIYILIRWASPGDMIMGTIGNSNYLGAYLIFPLYTMAGLTFLLKGRLRLIPAILFFFIMAAFLFSRARASWLGFFPAFLFFLYLLKIIHGTSFTTHFKPYKRKVVVYGLISLTILVFLWSVAPKRFHDMMGFHKIFESETLRLRVTKYFPPSIWIFKQSPLFGMGLWSYRNMVYEAQAEINKTDPDFFKNYNAPKPRRAHNDYLEILNDGGLIAATALLLLFAVVMAHGWHVIKDNKIAYQDRMITAVCFCSMISIMLAALFFFPFRVNSTMFMTVLMMGLMEGTYLRNRSLIVSRKGRQSKAGPILITLIFFILVGTIWYTTIRPFKGEMECLRYKKYLAHGNGYEAEKHLLRAIDYDPRNSAYHIYASRLYFDFFHDYEKAGDFVERAIADFNGDITMWTVYFMKGLVKFRMGSILEARSALEKSLYYNPEFKPAREKLMEVNKVIEGHEGVTIKFK